MANSFTAKVIARPELYTSNNYVVVIVAVVVSMTGSVVVVCIAICGAKCWKPGRRGSEEVAASFFCTNFIL